MGGPAGVPSQSYPFGYPPAQNQIPQDIYRESLQTAVLDKVRHRCNEISQLGKAQIDSLRKTEQDLLDGQNKLQSLIQDAQQQQVQAQVRLSSLSSLSPPSSLTRLELHRQPPKQDKPDRRRHTEDVLHVLQLVVVLVGQRQRRRERRRPRHPCACLQAVSVPPSLAPSLSLSLYLTHRLLQAYAEEHAIQDLLYYLADGLRRQSIGLDIYLKVRSSLVSPRSPAIV